MKRTVKIEGLSQLRWALATLPEATQRRVLVRVLTDRAGIVQRVWRQAAPRLSGLLAASIRVGTRLTKRQARETRRAGKSYAEVYVGTTDPAGVQQEFGNVNHPAQPSGRPAWNATQDLVLRGIADGLRAEIEAAARRIAKRRR